MGFGGHTRGEQQDTQRLLSVLGRVADALERIAEATERLTRREDDDEGKA
ncbi:MAG: hypothetical protein ABR529_07835 [Actinomycetota bacterium]